MSGTQKENTLPTVTPVEADKIRIVKTTGLASRLIEIPALRTLLNSIAQTFAALVTFDSGIETDAVAEKTSAAGVTIDDVNLKDGGVTTNTSSDDILSTNVVDGTTRDTKRVTRTAGVTTSAVRIASLPNGYGGLCIVTGATADQSNRFSDIVHVGRTTFAIISGLNTAGTPSARTYTVPTVGALNLQMASGTYLVTVATLSNPNAPV